MDAQGASERTRRGGSWRGSCGSSTLSRSSQPPSTLPGLKDGSDAFLCQGSGAQVDLELRADSYDSHGLYQQ